MYIGIDPGWTNLGWGVIDDNFKYVASGTWNPKSIGHGKTAINLFKHIGEVIGSDVWTAKMLGMERFVYYKGVHNPDSENILMVTGEITAVATLHELDFWMFRAVDWKTNLAKYLAMTQGFKNPSDSLDKKFSMAAAEAATGHTFKVDHEADASCLAYVAGCAWKALQIQTNRAARVKAGTPLKAS